MPRNFHLGVSCKDQSLSLGDGDRVVAYRNILFSNFTYISLLTTSGSAPNSYLLYIVAPLRGGQYFHD